MLDSSIEEHIRYGKTEASTAEVRSAAELAGALGFIEQLPDGFSTHTGEAAQRLSGGERQGLDLARTIVRGASVLIFDEPTSNLDAFSEEAFRRTIKRIHEDTGATIVLVGHRLSTVAMADKIIVMNNGQVIESGPTRNCSKMTDGMRPPLPVLTNLWTSRRQALPEEIARQTSYRDTMTDEWNLDGKSILVTGGTGSFGVKFIENVLERYEPKRLIVFSRDELKQYEMEHRFSTVQYPSIRYFIGDVRDRDRLELAMRGIDLVVHAAALKHVSTAEYNPFECIQTNVYGAENVVMAALRNEVDRVVALSTDKAVNPINLYGASKLASDKIFVAANNISGFDGPKFAVVRYGNVVGSRGSVVPLFRKLIADGAEDLPITDIRMTRFGSLCSKASISYSNPCAAWMAEEIFIPKIPSMRMVDLARVMAPNLAIKEIGIRPGEKLHEMLLTSGDARNTLEFEDRYLIRPTGVLKMEDHEYAFNGLAGRAVAADLSTTQTTIRGKCPTKK